MVGHMVAKLFLSFYCFKNGEKMSKDKKTHVKRFNELDVEHIRRNHREIEALKVENKAQAEALARVEARLVEMEMQLNNETKYRKLQEESIRKRIDRVEGAMGDLKVKFSNEQKSVAELKARFEEMQKPSLYANFNPAGQNWVEKSGLGVVGDRGK